MKKTVNRANNLDLLRIIACFMVIVLHVCAEGPLVYGEKGFLENTVINALTRFSVPVFVMISGYFLIEKEENASYFFKRAFKMLFIMIGWSSIYLIKFYTADEVDVRCVGDAVKFLLTEPVHLWYFYMLSVLILFTPFMSHFCKNSDKKTFQYILTLMFVFGFIITPLMKTSAGDKISLVTEKIKGSTLLAFPFYYMYGYYVRRFGMKKKNAFLWAVAGLLLTLTGVIVLSLKNGILYENALSFYFPGVAMFSIGIFSLFCNFDISEKRIIKLIAPLTGGIYGAHMIALPSVYEKMSFAENHTVRIFISSIAVFLVSGIVVFVIKKTFSLFKNIKK